MKENTGTDTMEDSVEQNGSDTPKRVIAIKTPLPLPKTELWHAVHIVGPENGPGFAQMLARAKCHKSKNGVQDADLVIFTGGSVDIHPTLYGVDPNDTHESVWFENQACIDTMMEYIEVWQECFYLGVPMVGVCLGAQFLAVMNGSKLYQDVDNHGSDHAIHCTRTGKMIDDASSVHHQAVIEDANMRVLAVAMEANECWKNRTECDLIIDNPRQEEVEAFFYEDTLCLGFQGHPEYQGYPEYTEWCLKQIEHHIVNNPKCKYVDNNLRMTQEALQRRNFTLPNSVHEFIKEYR